MPVSAILKRDVENLKYDPSNILGRVYDAIDLALYDINAEGVSYKDRLSQLTSIVRICVTLNSLNKGSTDVPIEYGSQVRQYEKLFTDKNAAGGRKISARKRTKSLEPLEPLDLDDGDNGLSVEDDATA